ncbi:MAG: hypothetical protein ACYC8W_05450 [Candidatus Tyrphobacter sp.]
MRFFSLLGVAALAAMIYGEPGAPAFAADANSAATAPVRVIHCDVYHIRGRQGAIHIGFENVTQRALNFVRFKVDFAGTTRTIDDRGVFSPGVGIHHEYGAAHPGTMRLTAVCTPIAAQFTDGTTWP